MKTKIAVAIGKHVDSQGVFYNIAAYAEGVNGTDSKDESDFEGDMEKAGELALYGSTPGKIVGKVWVEVEIPIPESEPDIPVIKGVVIKEN